MEDHARAAPVVNTEFRTGVERRNGDRRRGARAGAGRRRGDRRNALARAGILALLAGGLVSRMPVRMDPAAGARGGDIELSVAPEKGPAVPASPYDRIIEEASKLYGVSADLVRAVIKAESNFNPLARSRAGARGLMQLTPITLKELGAKIDPFNPKENIFAGTKYLRMMLDRNDGNVPLALASYNAGPNAVKRHKGMPPYRETRGYVRKIQGFMADAQDIADTTISDTTTTSD